jgi:hypothetical protein
VKALLNKLIYRFINSSIINKDVLLERLISLKENEEKQFYTLNKRPFKTDSFCYDKSTVYNSASIVMQGPLLEKNNFTYETIKLYASQVNPANIILSTWENENPIVLKQLEDLGITILLNKMPSFNGNQNINLQITSTCSGIIKAKKIGAKYILKTRTDQRICSTQALQLFDNLLNIFPLAEPSQKERLIITSLGTIKYRLYGAGDMLMYGNIDDMINYWCVDMDMRQLELKDASTYSIKEFSELRLGEMYLCSKYFEKLGYTLDWTLKQSWTLIAKYFCIIDSSLIDLYWPKYDLRNEFRYKYYSLHSLQNMTFTDWLSLHLKKVNHYPEEYLNSSFSEKLEHDF